MNGEELETFIWATWMEDLDTKAENTRKLYLFYFKSFLKRWDITASELYEMRKADFQSIEPIERKRIERMVKTSMAELKKAGYSASTCNQTGKAVSSFFDSMDMELRLKKKDMPKGESKGQVLISAPQILKIYERMVFAYRLRNRAILLSLKDSGLRVSDLSMMNYNHWLQAKTILNEHAETFKVFDPEHTKKMKVIAYVHLGPESVMAIDKYIEDRQERDEILTEESPLFIGQDGERITRNALTCIFLRQAKKLKFKRISAHSFRKFHTTILEEAGMPENWIKKLQGKVASVYSQPEETGKLTERYLACYDALRVLEKPRGEDEQHEKIDKLTHELGLSQYEIAELRDERDKYRAGYELRTRLQNIIDKARLDGWPEDIIKKLEENLESVETFEEGVFEFHKLGKDS